ncbi:hypothetical protein Hanom_Chr17g01588211 [Helianthus anomalus]
MVYQNRSNSFPENILITIKIPIQYITIIILIMIIIFVRTIRIRIGWKTVLSGLIKPPAYSHNHKRHRIHHVTTNRKAQHGNIRGLHINRHSNPVTVSRNPGNILW